MLIEVEILVNVKYRAPLQKYVIIYVDIYPHIRRIFLICIMTLKYIYTTISRKLLDRDKSNRTFAGNIKTSPAAARQASSHQLGSYDCDALTCWGRAELRCGHRL